MTVTTARLISIQIGLPRQYRGEEGVADAAAKKPWTSGIFKATVAGPVRVLQTNIEGDGQADLENHGGVDKAVLCYSADHYPEWRSQLGVAELPYGGFGENLTIAGVDERSVCIGDTWQVGNVLLQVSQPRQPCWKLGRRWSNIQLPAWVVENGRGGWYVRVLREGTIKAPLAMTLVERPHPQWTVDRANQIKHHRKDDLAAAAELAALPLLSQAWRESFERRLRGAAD